MTEKEVKQMVELLAKSKFNLLITGPTCSGKTELLRKILPQLDSKESLLIQQVVNGDEEIKSDIIKTIKHEDFNKINNNFNVIVYDDFYLKKDINRLCEIRENRNTIIVTTYQPRGKEKDLIFKELKSLLKKESPTLTKKEIDMKINNLFDFHIALRRWKNKSFIVDTITELNESNEYNEIIKFDDENEEYKTLNLPSILTCAKVVRELNDNDFDIWENILKQFNKK